MKIAVLGTGLMGAPMAKNLCHAGFNVTAWNRSYEKLVPLADHGLHVAKEPQDAIAKADIIISMFTDGAATAALQSRKEVRRALKPRSIWIEMASVKPKEARMQAADLMALDVFHLDAPVSGGTKGAQEARLAIMVGGDANVFEQVKGLFEALGRAVLVGPSGSGQLAKLANQAIVGISIGAVAEAILLLERGGADPLAVCDALRGGFADSTILQQHGKRMLERSFAPGGPSHIQLKDMENINEEAASLNITLPFAEQTQERYERLVGELNGGELDHSALFLELLEKNIAAGETS